MTSTTILCADSRCETSYQHVLTGRKADLLLTDPPYCLLTRRRKNGDERDKKARKIDRSPSVRFDSVRAYRAFTLEWLPKAVDQLSPSALLILWTNFLGKEPLLSASRECGYGHLWGEYVWAKRTKPSAGNEQLLRVYEVALVIGRRPQQSPNLNDLPTVWSVVSGYDDDGEAHQWGDHPHHKPFSVLEPLVRTYATKGGLILDPFAGSGSIPAAAVRLGRHAACIELIPEWAARVEARLKHYDGGKLRPVAGVGNQLLLL